LASDRKRGYCFWKVSSTVRQAAVAVLGDDQVRDALAL
jgi:hypothetical protein